ncbi:MAG: hypothetical protein ACRELB_08445, partial [Polyangiaceae bacterium]
IPVNATVRLSYVPLRHRPDGTPHELSVTWRGVDQVANVVRFDCAMGNHGVRSYAAPISDVEEAWCPKDSWHVRLSGYMDHVPLEPYQYISTPTKTSHAPTVHHGGGPVLIKAGDGGEGKGGDVVIVGDIRGGDTRGAVAAPTEPAMAAVLAAKKSDAIDRLSHAADELTGLILNFDPRFQGIRVGFPLVALPEELLTYPRLVHQTQIYLSADFLAELTKFGACAQTAYSELMALPQGDDCQRILAVHARVETARAHLVEASRRELHGFAPSQHPRATATAAAPASPATIPPMTADAQQMMGLVGDEYEKARFPRIEDWTIDGLLHEQKLKFELQAVGLLAIHPDGSCGLTATGKDWIMWRRRTDGPAKPLMYGGNPVPGFGDASPLIGGREVRGVEQAGEADIMSRVAKAAMSGVMNAYERDGFPEQKVYTFPYPPAADELRALGFFKEVGRDSMLVYMELTGEGRRWIMAHRVR